MSLVTDDLFVSVTSAQKPDRDLSEISGPRPVFVSACVSAFFLFLTLRYVDLSQFDI